MNIRGIKEREMVVSRNGNRLIVGPVVLVDEEMDLVAIRINSTETRNFHAREIQSVNFLLDYYFQNHHDQNHNDGNGNEERLKGIIKSLAKDSISISESLREEIQKELKEVPEVRGQEILEVLIPS